MENTEDARPTERRDPSGGRGRSRLRAMQWVLSIALLAGLLTLAVSRLGPIPERRYARIASGMSRAQVQAILGAPDRIYVDTPAHPAPWGHIGSSSPHSPYLTADLPRLPGPAVHANASEVWRWNRLLDQRIGIVYDGHGTVIFKWIDY